ncbi:E3 ubiquitin-protein ligase TRIM7 [Mastacembelus armatus]|uniref:E3 ubiquitin-protein ligase TRIM7 n=1 Tax=Mastacembelus armatus TaxID=205130 RepID=UPI000E464D5D|nr:E3 ubiquitin-protein ligase TRIM7-like [Mastacembelus armatus]XP_033181335.1 E3 ubiquitin-protein ligase TRIM7-like [Mastacembelus armatus]
MAMALSAPFLSEDQFTCSICLDVFNNPVSTPCGHSFCKACISSYWNTAGEGSKSYQCPLCKESFHNRPELHINLTLREITEQFKQMAIAGEPMDGNLIRGALETSNSHTHQKNLPNLSVLRRPGEMPGSVFAEMMTRFQQMQTPGVPRPTLSHPSDRQLQSPNQVSAQVALQDQNNEPHDPPPSYLPPHRYTGPSDSSPSLPLCPIHMRGLEFFCRTDNTCVCCICAEKAEHLGHNITPAKREWHIKKSQLGIAEAELKDLLCERERKRQEILDSWQQIQSAAERETHGAICVFSKLISTVEHCQAEVLEVIEMSRRAAEHRAQSLLRELEQEIAQLKKRTTELSQMAVCEDYILFLKTFPTLSTLPQPTDWSGASVSSELTSGVILRSVSQIMEHCQEEMRKLPEVCQQSLLDQPISRPTPKTRRVQEYAADITLDPYTAHPRLIISVDGKQVHCGERHQLVPDNPERFDRVVCVLARQGFNSGRHYWEVEVGGKTDWDMGVASQSVNRKGKISVSPAHGYWFLSLRDQTNYSFRTEPSTSLTVNPRPSRIGIYVDCDKGLLSFYNVEDRMLIYTFTDNFSGTIHPFFSPCTNKSGRNEAPLIICPVPMTE